MPTDPETFGLGGLSGTVYIQVVDLDRTPGKLELDSVYVDFLSITVE